MRTFVIGDIHGAYRALVQCLERSGFNKEEDVLITIGDICDGWDEVFECVEELMTIPNRIDIMGNHDVWFREWMNTTQHPDYWIQGGSATANSYIRTLGKGELLGNRHGGFIISLVREDIPVTHWKFFHSQVLYHKDDQRNMFFVHGGFDRFKTITENRNDGERIFYWDRQLLQQALSCKQGKLMTVDGFDEIFIGHTETSNFTVGGKYTQAGIVLPTGSPITVPINSGGVWNVDTGAGSRGKLTIMDIDTKEFWQSDLSRELYPEQPGRYAGY